MTRSQRILLLGTVASVCSLGAWSHHQFNQRTANTHPAELYDVVTSQLHAFKNSDFASAYRHVSSGFRERFGVDSFADFARSDFPELLRADHVEFGPVLLRPMEAEIQVFFVLPNAQVVPCIYKLILEDKGWKIDSASRGRPLPTTRPLGGLRI
jgi:hypothetical protein